MKVGFIVVGKGIGDNVISLKAMYECKKIYGAEVIVFGSGGIQELFKYCTFIDTIVDIKGAWAKREIGGRFLDKENLAYINENPCDYLILPTPRTHNIKLLRHCNAKKVITPLKPLSMLYRNFQSVCVYLCKDYKYMSREDLLCKLTRAINPKLYDAKVASLDYSGIRIQTSSEHKERIRAFLDSVCCNQNTRQFVLVNPFNIANPCTLSTQGWLRLILALSKLENVFIIIPTYKAVHTEFTKNLTAFITNENDNKPIPNLAIFQNDDDLLNLVALVEQMSLLIAPSTGTIHIASNLSIPTIGIYGEYDSRKYPTKDKRYVILEKSKYDISPQEEAQAIQEVLALTKSLISNK